ncbi:MAG: PfaB family protein [SAR324 cluster bacterium]|nr:PfaB family protein [SAR324 cluster bacterium]
MQAIAVIGLSCLFPEANTPAEYWQNLLQEKNSCTSATELNLDTDPSRFLTDKKGVADKFYCARGGYIRDFTLDTDGFLLPAERIEKLGETFQWPLHVAREALRDSGYYGNTKILKECGVVLGNLSFPTKASNHLLLPLYQQALDPLLKKVLNRPDFSLDSFAQQKNYALENSRISGLPASIVAQALGLSAHSLALDAACASSLYAVALACHYLQSGKTDLMLAGAVSAADPFFVNMGFSIFHAYPEYPETCNPLDNNSGGLFASQGAGMFVLKRLDDAERDGDHIHAVISGIGLSNDGRGQFVLSPNSKGQILAYERAYDSSRITSAEIDYIECHATGTPLGDKVELDSMEMFFAAPDTPAGNKTKPLIGSVKSNLGHMLTAAGMGGMTKVILALQNGIIPATVGVENVMTSKNDGVSADQIVRQATTWPHKRQQRSAAVSAFGFGGTNAHIVFEAANSEKSSARSKQQKKPVQNKQSAVAIIGMEAIFGGCNGLHEFYQTIYDNKQHFRKLPPERWKGLEQHPELSQVPEGAWLESFEMDFLRFKLQPNPKERLIPQQLLTLEVTDRALKKTNLREGQNVAVLVAMETELEIHRFRGRVNLAVQIEDSLEKTGISLSDEERKHLITLSRDSLLEEVPINPFTSFIGNIMAARISSLWDFSGPAMTISSEENSVFRALEIAQMLLAENNVDAVVITAVDLAGSPEQVLLRQRKSPLNSAKATLSFEREVNGWMIGEGAGTVVLKSMENAKKDHEQIYATLDALAFTNGVSAESVKDAGEKALKNAKLTAREIGILEVFGSGNEHEDKAEMSGLSSLYSGTNSSCAIGGIKANLGHTFAASGMASLIKTALCLHHRFIPGVPQWSTPKTELLSGNEFYVPVESRPWLIQPGDLKRHAAVSGLGQDNVCSHLILSEVPAELRQKVEVAESGDLSLFQVMGQDKSTVRKTLADLENDLQSGKEPAALARRYYEASKNNDAEFAAVLIGATREEILKEIEAAKSGIENSFSGKGDWSSPKGSYFTAAPLSREGKVAFTYPGGFSAYVDCGRSLFQMFPGLHELDEKFLNETGPADKRRGSNYLCELLQERRLFPRTLERLSNKELDALQEDFIHSPIAMFESGVSSAVLNTHVMRKGFGLEPQIAFGYSMGEISMLYGLGVWESMSNMSDILNTSKLFSERLAGPMNAVREAWKLGENEFRHETLWGCYTLRISAEEVQKLVDKEAHVYLILINTPEEVVIAGEPAACERVIKKLKRPIHPIPVTDVVHCEPVKTEYEEIRRVHTDRVVERPEIDFYSAIDYGVTKLDSKTLSHNIATIYGKTVDYSRLVETVYADGARIFVDLGPRATCSKWISKTLDKRAHLSVSVNRKGTDNRAMILKALSSLISHRVPVKLEQLFPEIPAQSQKQLPQTIKLGGTPIQQVFEKGAESFSTDSTAIRQQSTEMENRVPDYVPGEFTNFDQTSFLNQTQMIQNQAVKSNPAEIVPSFSPFPGEYGLRRNAAHAAFLKVRQQGLLQFSGIIGSILKQELPVVNEQSGLSVLNSVPVSPIPQQEKTTTPAIFDYQDLLELAGGNISNVFGPEFAEIDSYRRYVRLPMEPYLLVSRVTKIDGKLGEFKPSTITTEYDIPNNAWYTTDGQIPWAVAVESGQCDLLLISYLGIDFQCKGEQVYRLLDCTLTYLDDMPLEGQTLRYEISINSFAKHDQNLLFFFNYECFVGSKMVLRMDGGCAGFFSDEDLAHGRGVIHTAQELELKQKAEKNFFPALLHCPKTSFSRQELLEISNGNPAGCFGTEYNQHGRNPSLKNAPDQFLMSDRVLSVEPNGGAYGLGYIVAEKDLAPDDWYFPCHFKDDPVMAGSLMAEGCVQLLQFFLLHLGLQTLVEDATFQPIHDLPQIVRCRGQVIPGDPKITYHVEVKEIGLEPHPYAIADIDILVGERIVVDFRDLGVQLADKSGSPLRVTKNQRKPFSTADAIKLQNATPEPTIKRKLIADEQMIWEFALGDITKCFGADYAVYKNRPMQRNPNGDLQLISRVYDLHGKRMEFDKPMTIVSEYDVPEDAWFFRENSHPTLMPYSVLMEIALQPCGFISTQSGAILIYPEIDLHYRNLDGNGTLLSCPDLRGKTIVNEVELLSTVASGNTIIQNHRFALSCDGQKFYEGDTVFGYFTHDSLANQVGLDSGKKVLPWISENPTENTILLELNSTGFRQLLGENPDNPHFHLCDGQLSFSDEIRLVPEGGKYGKGYAYARKEVNPKDWFFPCHFHEDPVMPGSLGLEAIIQTLQAFSLQKGLGASFLNPRFSPVMSKVVWKYRGQILPQNKFMQLELHVKNIAQKDGEVIISADANLWREDLRIYEISDIVLGISEA